MLAGKSSRAGLRLEGGSLRAHLREGQKSLSLEEERALPCTTARAGTDLSSNPWLCLGLFESNSLSLCEA